MYADFFAEYTVQISSKVSIDEGALKHFVDRVN